MIRWQQLVSEHHDIIVLDDTSIKIENVAYDKINNYDDVITKNSYGYCIETYMHDTGVKVDSMNLNDIQTYLGY